MKYRFFLMSYENKIFSGFRLFVVATVLSLIPVSDVKAQKDVDYAVHANIIYHFTKYVEWPQQSSGSFVVGVVGETPLYDELVKVVKNRTAGNRKIEVKKMSTNADFDCEILFISEYSTASLKKIAAKTAGSPVLLVTEEEGVIDMGSCINLIVVSERLKMEINKTNIHKRKLFIANELLQLGKVVQ